MAGRIEKLKAFFSKDSREVTTKELMELRKADKDGYDNLADQAARYVDENPEEFPELEVKT